MWDQHYECAARVSFSVAVGIIKQKQKIIIFIQYIVTFLFVCLYKDL